MKQPSPHGMNRVVTELILRDQERVNKAFRKSVREFQTLKNNTLEKFRGLVRKNLGKDYPGKLAAVKIAEIEPSVSRIFSTIKAIDIIKREYPELGKKISSITIRGSTAKGDAKDNKLGVSQAYFFWPDKVQKLKSFNKASQMTSDIDLLVTMKDSAKRRELLAVEEALRKNIPYTITRILKVHREKDLTELVRKGITFIRSSIINTSLPVTGIGKARRLELLGRRLATPEERKRESHGLKREFALSQLSPEQKRQAKVKGVYGIMKTKRTGRTAPIVGHEFPISRLGRARARTMYTTASALNILAENVMIARGKLGHAWYKLRRGK